jgi:hypothetical protein
MFEIEYEFGEEDLIHFNAVRYMKTEDYKNDVRKNRLIVPGVLLLMSAFYYFYYKDMNTAAYIVAIAGLWSLFVPKTLLSRWQHKLLSSYTAKEKSNMFGTYNLSIDPANPTYLLEKSPSGKNKMPWADLVRVEYGKRYVYIYIDLTTALVIPVDKVKKGDLEAFAEQAEKMIERFA